MSEMVASKPNSASKPAKPLKLTPAVARAIDIMVWQGKRFNEAAQEVGLTSRAMRLALQKPHVLAHMKREMQVLRESERPRSICRLTELRDQDDNKMVAFNAAKELAGSSADEQSSAQRQAMPGLVVVVNTIQRSAPTSQLPVITVNDE